MQDVAQGIEYVNDVLFVGLAVVAFRQWRSRRDPQTAWVAVTFALLSAVVVGGLLLPDAGDQLWRVWATKALLVGLLLFPWALYRFTVSFHGSRPRVEAAARALTAGVLAVTVLLPDVPAPTDVPPSWWRGYVLAVLVYWSALSVYVSVQLWRAGAGKPTVARRRMRILAAAASTLNVALLLAGAFPSNGEATAVSIAVALLATTSALLFYGAFAPPRLVRVAWRRPEEVALQDAQMGLMAAQSPAEVVALLLPHGVGVVGAGGAALIDHAGQVIGVDGVSAGWALAHADDDDVLSLPLRSGRLLLWAGPHTPYFGREELDLLARFGVVIDLAWVRCELLERQRETTVRLEEAQRIARLGAWEMDLGSGAIIWSAEMYRIFDVAEGSPVTLATFTDRLHPDDLDIVMAEMARTIEGGLSGASMDYRIVLPDGSVRTVHGQGQVQAAADGRPARLVGTAHDITDRKAAEDALNSAYEGERAARLAYERANDELESFVYSVSHDLKSPIISLLGYLDYLRLDYGSLLPPEAGHYLDRMTSSAGYMEALIQDLLELSRIGRVQTDPEVVDLGALVADIAAELSAAHPEASVAVDPLPSVLANPVRARQLFTNLIGNALDHAGRGDVHVRVHAEPAAGGAVAVLVTDDGRGIPDAYREKVFGVFERLDSPGDPAGTGIGLAICRKVMDGLGGSIAVDDVPQGTRMRLEFPASAVVGARTGAVTS